jgi:DNA-binding transcriptional MerR regulator
MSKSMEAFRTISEVADELEVPKHVLRFWEVKFPQVRPMKRGGGRRYYRPEDLELLRGIRHLLHAEAYTIKGVQKILREQGIEHVKRFGRPAEEGASAADAKRKRGEAPPPIVAEPPTPAPRSSATRAAAKAPRGDVLKALIAELQACRKLILGEEVAASTGPAAQPASRRQRSN